MSPSGMNLMDECPQCFWLQHHGEPRPSTPFPSITNGIDSAMKRLFDGYRYTDGMTKFRAQYVAEQLRLPPGYTPFQEQYYVDKYRERKNGLWYGFEGTEYEHRFRVHGLIDDLLTVYDTGKTAVIDFKSKGSAPKDGDGKWYIKQLSIYAYLLSVYQHEMHDKAVLYYVYPDNPDIDAAEVIMQYKSVEVPVRPYEGKEIIDRAVELLDGPIPDASDTCGFCKYVNSRTIK